MALEIDSGINCYVVCMIDIIEKYKTAKLKCTNITNDTSVLKVLIINVSILIFNIR